MKDLWDQSAEQYDHYARTYPQYKETSQKLVEFSELRPGDIVIDLACGTGATTEQILELQPDVSEVIALDNSEAMLAKARKNTASPKVRFVCAEAEAIDDATDAADRVLCNSAFWQFPKPEDTLRAVSAVLAEDGLCTFNFPQQFFDMGEDSHRNRFMRTLFEALDAEGFTPKRQLKGKYTEEQVRVLAQKSNLQLLKAEYFKFEGKGAEDSEAFLGIPATAPFFDGIPEDVQKRVLNKAKAALENDPEPPPPSTWVYFMLGKAL